MITNSPLIFVFGAGIILIVVVYGVLCLVSPAKMIKAQAKISTLVSERSATDRVMIWQYRIMGVIFVVCGLVFLLMIVGAALERLSPGGT